MFNDAIFLLCLVNFGFIALLPRKFFRQGAQLTLHFWLTAAPLFACPAFLTLTYFGVMSPFISFDSPWMKLISMVALMISTVSILMLGMAIGAHRIPIHMFHDKADHSARSSHLVTYGPYRWVRHPIYSAYLLALWAGFLACPQIGTLISLVYGITLLSHTAKQEEDRLCQSPELGEEYREYMTYTGRFLPPLKAFHMQGREDVSFPKADDSATRADSDVPSGAGHATSDH